jgi:hemolysin III
VATVSLGRPRLRGVFHQYAFAAAVAAGTVLVLRAPTPTASIAAAVYAASVCGLFGVSALYHRITWTASVRRRLRQLDHAMIFLLIAGTYTPVGLLVLEGPLAVVVLGVVWSGAVVGVALHLGWRHAPSWVGVVVYVALGWVAVVAVPQLIQHLGGAGTALLLGGGLAYTAGAVVYARRRPSPVPAVFGYHEVFHLLVVLGVAAHFAAVTLAVLAA